MLLKDEGQLRMQRRIFWRNALSSEKENEYFQATYNSQNINNW